MNRRVKRRVDRERRAAETREFYEKIDAANAEVRAWEERRKDATLEALTEIGIAIRLIAKNQERIANVLEELAPPGTGTYRRTIRVENG